MRYIYDEIKDTALYAAAERDGRLFDSRKAADLFAEMFGGRTHAIVQYTPFREAWQDEVFEREYIVL